ncbi:MAG: response regulator [Halobacteriovoraceae bacterium]|jgi:chemotaxis protein CheX|nr:response regulator [Halobacteriovoraceae bacterium]
MARKFLLIAEADEEMRQQLTTELEDLTQMIVVAAGDGIQAFQKTRNQKFDVILTDFKLAKITELQLITALRESTNNTYTPILIYTKDTEDAKVKTRGIKSIEFIDKPAEYQKISDKIIELSKLDPTKKKFKIDVDFINPFIDSSIKTLNGLCGVSSIEAQKPHLLGEEVLEVDISGTLAITSPYFKGSIAITFDDNVYKKIISKMLEENIGDIDLNNQDGAAEIINIIFGQTKAVLNQRGYSLDRAIPSVMRGRGHKIYQDSKIPVLLVPFRSDLGKFWMQICVKAI